MTKRSLNEEEQQTFKISWNSQSFEVSLEHEASIFHLKLAIAEKTQVLPEKQKLIGLIKGKLPSDDTVLEDLPLVAGHKVFVMGTRDEDLKEPNFELLPDVVNDLDWDYSVSESTAILHDVSNHKKLLDTIRRTNITLMNGPMTKKRLLVLDLDYTLFDCKARDRFLDHLRPGTHDMLSILSKYYEICVWSQTSWRWLEAKLTELGMLTNDAYKLSFVLDKSTMFTVTRHVKSSKERKSHEVKALELIYAKFPQFSANNTIHIDDLSRNFAMNPQSGLKIKAFKDAKNSKGDRELFHLTKYLLKILNVEDWTSLDHAKWKDYQGEYPTDVNQNMKQLE